MISPGSGLAHTPSLVEAIRSSAGGQMTRHVEVFLAGVCAQHLTQQLALGGFVFMRRLD